MNTLEWRLVCLLTDLVKLCEDEGVEDAPALLNARAEVAWLKDEEHVQVSVGKPYWRQTWEDLGETPRDHVDPATGRML